MRNSPPCLRVSVVGRERLGPGFRLGMLCAALLPGVGAGTAECGELRVAVIAGETEHSPWEVVFAKLEVELSREAGMGLVERSRVRRILAEHSLAAAGPVDAATAARIGRLLSADLLIFVERLPGTRLPACRIHTVEARTGITLGAVLGSEKSLVADVSPVVHALRSALAKLGVPRESRRYVGVLGFRSEEPGRSLDGLAEALGALLATDLGASPSVVLLDREHLEHLTAERDLTGVELKLKASALLLDGGLRRAPGGAELEITVHMRPLAEGERRQLAVLVPADDVPRARRALRKAVLDKLRAEAVEAEDRDPKKEAAIFAERAGILVSHEEYGAALRAAEAAFALDRNQETRYWAAKAWHDQAWKPYKAARRRVHKGEPLAEMPADLKARILKAHLRQKTLTYELYRHHELRFTRGEEENIWLPVLTGGGGTIRIPALPGEKEVEQLYEEIERLDRDMSQFRLDYYGERWDDKYAQSYWWRELDGSMYQRPHWADDAGEWAALLREAIALYESPPGKPDARFRHSFLFTLVEACRVTLPRRFAAPEDGPVVLDALDALARRHDPLLRMTGHVCKVVFTDYEDADSARAALDVLLDELPLDHPERPLWPHWVSALPRLASRAIQGFEDAAERAGHYRAVIGPIIEARDARRLVEWRLVIPEWFHALERRDRLAEADEVARRLIELLRQLTAGSRRGKANKLVRSLEERRARYAEQLARGLPLPAGWAAYEMNRVDFAAPAGIRGDVRTSCLRGSRLILVRAEGTGSGKVRVQATRAPVGGGAEAFLGEATVECGRANYADWVTCAATDGRGVYVGTAGGLCVFRNGKATAWTEEKGLPASRVRSAACYEGKVYLGVGEGSVMIPSGGALVTFDPATTRFEILASSRSQEGRNPLDGGKPYSINAILADEERKCLWLGVSARHVSSRDRPLGRQGLWKYHPEERRAEFAWTTRSSFDIAEMRWHRGKIICWSWPFNNLATVDPETLEKARFAGIRGFRPADDCRGLPLYVFGDCHVALWPCALIGDALLTGGKHLRLHEGGQSRPSILRRTPEGKDLLHVVFMHEVGDGVIVGTRWRGFWTIRRKARAGGERR